ncbi:hypothetical protein Tco_0612122, partial [Tanacetum coccineum]
VANPKAIVDEVREHFSNTLYGYFIGKRYPFLIMEKYVLNTWAKYGIERAIIRNGFYGTGNGTWPVDNSVISSYSEYLET